uniref:Uncharacterized protein n=1 Tax=Brassica oleracea var. oleracea TaxID=109376 RepID=A0A0D3BCV6_BRAOL
MGVNETVRKAFYAKAKVRLLDTVSNWKVDWIVKGMSVANPLSSPRMCGMASSVIGGILTPLESPSLALPPVTRDGTHKNKAGQFLDGKSEQIFNDLVARVDDRQTQLTQKSTDRLPVTLSALEVDRIYEDKKRRTLVIGSVNNVVGTENRTVDFRLNKETRKTLISQRTRISANYHTSSNQNTRIRTIRIRNRKREQSRSYSESAYERLQQGISLGSRAVGEILSSSNPKTAKPN